MASYGERWLFDADTQSSGAVLFMQRPARRSSEYTSAKGWTVVAARDQRGLVIRGPSLDNPDEALDRAIESAHIALDVFAVKGTMARLLDDPHALHVVWWRAADGIHLRAANSEMVRMEMEVVGVARDRQGKVIPPSPKPPTPWHPSFRYFRVAQATADLLEAFRNLYLALESLLSSIVSINPGEREHDWLSRALNQAMAGVDASMYLPSGRGSASGQLIPALVDEIYGTNRTAAFHAKDGRRVLLPYDASEREALKDTTRRLRRLYVDLVHARLGVSFGWGTQMAAEAFGSMFKAVLKDTEAYISPTWSRKGENQNEAPLLPSGYLILPTHTLESSPDGYDMTLLASAPCPQPPPAIREFGGAREGNVGLYELLEEKLEVDGTAYLEVVVVLRGDRDGTAIPEYPT